MLVIISKCEALEDRNPPRFARSRETVAVKWALRAAKSIEYRARAGFISIVNERRFADHLLSGTLGSAGAAGVAGETGPPVAGWSTIERGAR